MPTIVSVHSYRGGTGKSNLVTNLAGSVAQMGKRAAVIDTDVQSPGLHVLFGMDVQTIGKNLNDYLYGRCGIEQAAHDVTAKLGPDVAPGGTLYLIPASINAPIHYPLRHPDPPLAARPARFPGDGGDGRGRAQAQVEAADARGQ
ncbi:MAG: AAA family ATPase [Ktedonobacteraceae bacterium]